MTAQSQTNETRRVVLLVDDEPNVLNALRRALRKENYHVLTATSGEEALAILKERPVDAIVSDQEMPGMTGTELLSRVSESYPDTVRFMLTGRATLEVAIEAINSGAITRFFNKPCNGSDLTATIRQALEHRELMAEALRLLKKTRRQDVILAELEKQSPGITELERDGHQAIDLGEGSLDDYNRLIEDIRHTLGDDA